VTAVAYVICAEHGAYGILCPEYSVCVLNQKKSQVPECSENAVQCLYSL